MSKIWLNNLETVFENVAHISTSELLPALELAIGCQKSGSIVDALELLGLIPRRPFEVWGSTGWQAPWFGPNFEGFLGHSGKRGSSINKQRLKMWFISLLPCPELLVGRLVK